MAGPSLGPRDRLLAEAVRLHEGLVERTHDEPVAERAALAAADDPEARLVARARGLTSAPAFDDALGRASAAVGWVGAGLLVLGLLGGWAAAQAALGFGREDRPNVVAILGALLLVQSLFLAVFVVLAFARPRHVPVASLGAASLALARRMVRRAQRDPVQEAAASAWAGVQVRSGAARWTIGVLSHGAWLAFNVGALAALVLALSTRHYVFVWETTLLSERTFAALVRALAAGPAALGFDAPSPEQVRATQWPPAHVPDEASRQAWSGLLVGSVALYGLAPRALLLALCAFLRVRALRRFRLDTALPGYLRLIERWSGAGAGPGIVDAAPSDGTIPLPAPPAQTSAERPAGPPAVLSIEIRRPTGGWPPRVPDVTWRDLGAVDGGDERREVLRVLSEDEREPAALVAVCDLTTTPDRGIGGFLARLRGSVARAPVLVLSGGDALRRRGDAEATAARVRDWRELAQRAGFDDARVLELDLDHWTDAGAAKLAARLGDPLGDGAAAVPERRLERAMAVVAEHAGRWDATPSTRERLELQQEIARLHGGEQRVGAWRGLVGAAGEWRDLAQVPERLRGGARRVVDLLPPRLRASPRWLAAGAAAGALGCVAAGLLVTPAAVAALPTWSALGAAVGGAVQAFRGRGRGGEEAAEPGADAPVFDEAVRAAALFAALLELQGRGEAAIARVLDGVLDDDGPPIADAAAARAWLEGFRHRFDLALAAEARA